MIYQFDGIKEAAVVGVSDPRKGEMVVACVTPVEEENSTKSAVGLAKNQAGCLQTSPVMKMEALPRNATGKILKTNLREIAAERLPH